MEQNRKSIAGVNINRIKTLYRDKEHTVSEVAKKLNISVWSLYGIMSKNNIPRRSYSEANYVAYKDKPKFKVKEDLSLTEQKLKVAGIMLYWAEGTLNHSTVDFVNSNPQMIRIFLKFLREICGVNEERLRAYIYTYSYLDLEKVKSYWSDVTKIPSTQFTKPYVRDGNPNISLRKLPHGLVHIRYNDKRLLETIGGWIRDYTDNLR